MLRPATFRWHVVGRFATALIVVSLAAFAQAEEFEQETARLVTRLNFRGSDNEFTFPAGPDEVGEICERLYEIGPEARSAIPVLIQLLSDNDRYSGRSAVTVALTGMSGEAVPALRRALRDAPKEAGVLMSGADALRNMGRNAAAAIPELIDLLRHDDLEVRHAAMDALVHIDVLSRERVIGISGLLQHDSERTRSEAARTLRQMQGAEVAIPKLIEVAVADKSPHVRIQALRTLAHIDSDGRRAARILVDSLDDDDNTSDGLLNVGVVAATELAAMGQRAAPAIPTLIAMCNEDKLPNDEFIQRHVFEVFAYNTELAAPARPFLRKQLAERFDEAVQRGDEIAVATCLSAAGTLFRMEPLDQQARDVVVSVLRDPRWNRASIDYGQFGTSFRDPRPTAAEIGGRLQPPARETLPILKRLMAEGIERQHNDLAATAAWAIARIDHNDMTCVPAVFMYFWRFPETAVHSESSAAVAATLKPRSEACLPKLLDLLFYNESESDLARKGYLADVIVALGDESISQVIDRSLKAVSRRPWERGETPWDNIYLEFEVLPLLGQHAMPAVPKLLANLRDEDHLTRARSAEMLGRLKLDADKVVPELIARLSDDRAIVRARAAEALGSFGPDAISAVELLQAAERDCYLVVRTAARQSLTMIQAGGIK